MNVSPSSQPQAAASPPPQNESGPTSRKVEPVRQHSTRAQASAGENSTPAAVGVKRERKAKPEAESEFERKARAKMQADIAAALTAQEREEKEAARPENLRIITKAFGEAVERILRRGPQWEVHFKVHPERPVIIGSVSDLFSSRRVAEATALSRGKVLKSRSKDAWDEVSQAILDAQEVVYESDDSEETLSWIREHWFCPDDDLLDRSSANYRANCYRRGATAAAWREGKQVVVHLPSLLAKLQKDGMKAMRQVDLGIRLSRAGFVKEPTQRGFHHDKKLLRVRVWAADLAAVADDSPIVETPATGQSGSEE